MVEPFNNVIVTPPDEKVEGGIVSAMVIDIADIHVRKNGTLALDIQSGTITKIHMKRKGTYHGQWYDRAVQQITFQ